MNRNYKVGDWVIFIDKEDSNSWKRTFGVSLYKKVAKIIDRNDSDNGYLLEFKDSIGTESVHNNYKGKRGHSRWAFKKRFKSINHLKFKKWIKK